MLGFQTTPGSGGRERATRKAWLELTKLQVLAAKQVANEVGLRSVWSWGWGVWSKGESDPDKPAAACVYLWARNSKLCDAPAMAGKGFDTSRTEGQLIFARGVRCTLYGQRVLDSTITGLSRVTGDQDAAFTAAFARVLTSTQVKLKPRQLIDAERGVVASQFHGSFAAYRAALGKAHATPAVARGVIGDELRRMAIEKRLRGAPPSAADVREYYATYGDTEARLVETKSAVPWLGKRRRGFALASNAPPQLFNLGAGWKKVRTLSGTVDVRALDVPVALGTIPLDMARTAVVNALQELGREDAYESWLLSREHVLGEQALCRKDQQPQVGIVPLTDYLPFLAAS
jgi:hypothetical protein